MPMVSTFEVQIHGNRVFGHPISELTSKVFTAVRKLDPGVKVEEHHFARLGYRARWYGKPIHFDVIDNVQARVKRIVSTDLDKWKYSITIHYREVG